MLVAVRLSRLTVLALVAASLLYALPQQSADAASYEAPTLIQPEPGAITGSSTQAQFTGTASAYTCWLDNVLMPSCGSPMTISGLKTGPHQFKVAAGTYPATGPESKVAFTVVAPTAMITGGDGEDEFVNYLLKVWEVSTDLPAAKFECKLGSPFSPAQATASECVPPIQQELPVEGIYTFQIRAIDDGGNAGGWADRPLVADRTAPTIGLISGPADGSLIDDTMPEFIFRSNEVGSFACALDGADYIPCNIPHPIGPLSYGKHTLSTVAVDKASNRSAPDTRTFTVVDKLPAIAALTVPDSDILNPTPRKSRSARRVKTIRGKASGGKITRVDIGVLQIGWRKSRSGRWVTRCRWMTSKGAFKPGSCKQKKWHKARGTTKFSYKLKRRLKVKNSYKFYSRARNSAGQIERHFSRRDKTRVPVRILRK